MSFRFNSDFELLYSAQDDDGSAMPRAASTPLPEMQSSPCAECLGQRNSTTSASTFSSAESSLTKVTDGSKVDDSEQNEHEAEGDGTEVDSSTGVTATDSPSNKAAVATKAQNFASDPTDRHDGVNQEDHHTLNDVPFSQKTLKEMGFPREMYT